MGKIDTFKKIGTHLPVYFLLELLPLYERCENQQHEILLFYWMERQLWNNNDKYQRLCLKCAMCFIYETITGMSWLTRKFKEI